MMFLVFFLGTYPFMLPMLLVPGLRKAANTVRRLWPWFNFPLVGLFIRPMGARLWSSHKPYVFVSNHTAFLDIPTILAVVPNPIRFMAKHSLAKVPLFGIWFRTVDIPVNRGNRRES